MLTGKVVRDRHRDRKEMPGIGSSAMPGCIWGSNHIRIWAILGDWIERDTDIRKKRNIKDSKRQS